MAKDIKLKTDDEGNITKSGICTVTNKEYSVTCKMKDYEDWIAGKYIQDAMPYLTDDQRGFMITGFTPDEWNEIFSEDDDDELLDDGPDM